MTARGASGIDDAAGAPRADARPLPRRGGLRRARRRARLLRGLRRGASRRVLLLPTWSIVHSRHWKPQIPYLARHARVITFDGARQRAVGPPVGRRGVPPGASSPADALAVLDATGTDRAIVVGLSAGAPVGLAARRRASRPGARRRLHRPRGRLASPHPERHRALLRPSRSTRTRAGRSTTATTGSATTAASSSSSSAACFTEPHSTKQIEDCVGWGLETTPETLADTRLALTRRQRGRRSARRTRASAARCS